MPHYSQSRRVAVPVDQLFSVVSDVSLYPDFIAGITEIIAGDDVEGGGGSVSREFTLVVSAIGMRQEATGRVLLDAGRSRISFELVKGPMSNFHALFQFKDDGDETRLAVDVSCEFRNKIVAALVTPFFDTAMRKLVAAFAKRALSLAGPAYGGR